MLTVDQLFPEIDMAEFNEKLYLDYDNTKLKGVLRLPGEELSNSSVKNRSVRQARHRA
jgi:hypothetical protein